MRPFDDPEVSRPKMPADMLAFVQEVERNVEKGDGGADEQDTLTLVAIVREQAAELATFRKDLEDAAGELMVPVPAPGSVAAKMLLANRIMFRERDALRERLAKHEKAAAGLRDARADVLASNHPGFDGSGDRFYEALDAIEVILREDAVK